MGQVIQLHKASSTRTKDNNMNIDPTELINVELGGLNHWDYPDYADVYLYSASYPNGMELTEDELDWVTENCSDWLHELALEWGQ